MYVRFCATVISAAPTTRAVVYSILPFIIAHVFDVVFRSKITSTPSDYVPRVPKGDAHVLVPGPAMLPSRSRLQSALP